MPDDHHGLPTPRTTLAASYRLLELCQPAHRLGGDVVLRRANLLYGHPL
jgi:hypothetical protein